MIMNKSELDVLIKIADKLDSENREEEAKAVDFAIAKLAAAAEKEDEEEKDVGGLSGKQKAALKALKTVCERVTKVLGNRIPRSCKKLDDKCEEILEVMKGMDLD